MKWNEVIGQDSLKEQLKEMVQHNRLSHALLLLGGEGVGALPLALAMAQYMVCEKVAGKQSDANGGASLFGEEEPASAVDINESCGTCPACQKAAQLIHPDIHFSYPTVTKKPGEKPIATDFITEWREFVKFNPYGNLFDWIESIKEKENSQGKITAEECNDIIRKLSLKSFESEYKILILWMPEMMGAEGNKLLKLIEEPPANTLFILVAKNEAQILPTIISRCQLIKVPSLSAANIETALIERNHSDASTARQISLIADGSYREALQLSQHAEEDWQALLREWLNATLKYGPVAQVKWVDEMSKLGREKQKQFLLYFNHLLEMSMRLRILGDAVAIGEKERDFAARLNRIATIEQQEAIVQELDRAGYHIERNANAKILFHALTIKLYHIIQDKMVFLNN